MTGRRRTVAIGATVAAVVAVVAGAVVAGLDPLQRRAGARSRPGPPPSQSHRAQGRRPARQDDASRRSSQQVQLLSDGQITDEDADAGRRRRLQPGRPGAGSTSCQQIAVEESRLHIPILFAYDTIHGYRTIFPVPLGAASSLRPVGRRPPTPRSARASPRPSASSRSTARWSTSRTSRAGAGSSRATARTRTSARSSRPPGSRAPRAATTPRRTRSSPSVKHFVAYGQPEGGRDYNTTDMSESAAAQPLPAAVQGRDRRRLRHGDVLVQRDQRRPGLRQPVHRDRHPEEGVGLRRLHRERLHGRRRAARLPAEEPRRGPVRPRHRRRRPRGRARGARWPAPTRRWSAPTSATTASSCSTQGRIIDGAARRRGAADPAREVPRRAVRAPVRRPGQGRRPGQLRDRRPTARPRAPRPAGRWCC